MCFQIIIGLVHIYLQIVFLTKATSAQLYGSCPPGFRGDGSCATLHVCMDPHERCISGICCEPMEMPYGYGSHFGFPLGSYHHGPIGGMIGGAYGGCFDMEESCIHFVQYCNVPSVTQVCLHTCGLCGHSPYMPYGGIPYGVGGMPYGGVGGGGAPIMG